MSGVLSNNAGAMSIHITLLVRLRIADRVVLPNTTEFDSAVAATLPRLNEIVTAAQGLDFGLGAFKHRFLFSQKFTLVATLHYV